MSARPLIAEKYETTPEFAAIPRHTAVAFADDKGLVAVTGPLGDAEAERYAQLFAAAPELLASLKEVIEDNGLEPGDFAGIERALAVIAKAEGR